jgi:hypothetical protein
MSGWLGGRAKGRKGDRERERNREREKQREGNRERGGERESMQLVAHRRGGPVFPAQLQAAFSRWLALAARQREPLIALPTALLDTWSMAAALTERSAERSTEARSHRCIGLPPSLPPGTLGAASPPATHDDFSF